MDKFKLNINGKNMSVTTHSMKRLLDSLREDAKLTGSKEGCGEGECGACSVLVDGKLVNSCLIPTAQMHGKKVVTIEGLKNKTLQQCFIKHGAAQCGICTPGMLMAAHWFLEEKKKRKELKKVTRDQIKEALAGNLCRCTGYIKIFDAVLETAQIMGKK